MEVIANVKSEILIVKWNIIADEQTDFDRLKSPLSRCFSMSKIRAPTCILKLYYLKSLLTFSCCHSILHSTIRYTLLSIIYPKV